MVHADSRFSAVSVGKAKVADVRASVGEERC